MSTEEVKKPRITKEREALLKTVENLGIDGTGLSDADLLQKVVGALQKTNDQLATHLATDEITNLKSYSSAIEHTLKDQEFIRRLKNLNVPPYYLLLFRDEDSDMTENEIWGIVNKSGINPYDNAAELFKERASLAFAKSRTRRRR